MAFERNVVVAKMKSWLGKKESDGSHKSIIDTYNSISPLPVGYKVTYTDAWCAACVSAAYHAVGYDAIFPSECGCGRMITKAKEMGIWQEDDGYTPKPADCILYDWDDNGSGDCAGNPEHVGMVEYVNGNTIHVIEGNKSDSVSERDIKINGQYIRGFITPHFTEGTASAPIKYEPRLSRPTGGKFYNTPANGGINTCIQGSPRDATCDVLANCVGYANGRFNEVYYQLTGQTKNIASNLNCNAEGFIERAKSAGLKIGDKPQVGAIICWQKGNTLSGDDGAGHVAVVEQVIDDNTIVTSESGYGSSNPFWTTKRTNSNGRWGQGSGYTFRGFIYNPAVTDSVVEAPTVVESKATYAVGDVVKFTGTKHYTSADAKTAKACTPGIAKVTQVYRLGSSKHPYHLIATGVDKSNVYGWVDAADIAGAETVEQPKPAETPKTVNTEDNSVMKQIWDFFSQKIGNDFGVAGVMGNIYAESAYVPTNLQNSYEAKLGFTDESYTKAVDDGSYTNFVHDSAGYGLVQFTFWSLKEDLYNAAKKAGKSIGDLNVQLEVIWKQFGDNGLQSKLKAAKSIREASDLVLLKYERPADQGEAVQIKRAGYGQTAYDKYAGQAVIHEVVEPKVEESIDTTVAHVKEVTAKGYAQTFNKSVAGVYKVKTGLNLRDGAGLNYKVLTVMPEGLKVNNYGYYSDVSGTRWMYVQYTYNGVKYTGFCSNAYLTKC